MKKLILTILFLALAGLTVYYFLYRKGSTINKSEKVFALNDSKNIDRIILIKGNEKVILLKESKGWSLNGKEARTDLINMLIGVSEGLDAIAPVPKIEIDSVIDKLKTGIKIAFYAGEYNMNSYTLCKCSNSIYGLRDGYENPYKITLRGFSNIDLTKIYNTKENHWLTNLLINIEPEKIKSVSLEYPKNPDSGFILNKSDDSGYKLVRKITKKELSDTDPEIISEYLYFFSNIRYFPVDDTTSIRSNFITSQNNFFHLTIQSFDGQTVDVSGYAKPEVESDQTALLHFYSVDSNNNIISLKFNDFDPILVHADYFLKK
jgi:hypothetical protein